MATTVTKETYGNYGNCLKLSNEVCDLYVTTDIGPRIISYSLKGKENVFMNDTERAISNSGAEFDDYYYPGAAWYIYGGHRMWTSPEDKVTTYYPDNDPVEYDIIPNGVVLKCPPQKQNGVQFRITLTLAPDSSAVEVIHRCDNISEEDKRFALWALSVMDGGGIGITPMPKAKTGLLANRVLSLWDYSAMNDKRVYWGDRYITLKHDGDAEGPFKYGIKLEDDWAAYLNHEQLFVKRFKTLPDGDYPDFGVSFESYTCAMFEEIETLSEFVTLKPGQSTTHAEKWELSECTQKLSQSDEAGIDDIVKKHII